MPNPPLTSFIQRHQHAIDHSWFTDETFVVVFNRNLTSQGVAKFMADLITDTQPIAAMYEEKERRLILRFA